MCEKPVREQKIHVRAPVFLMMSEISCSDICGIMTKHLEKQRSFMSDMCPQKSVFRYAHLCSRIPREPVKIKLTDALKMIIIKTK